LTWDTPTDPDSPDTLTGTEDHIVVLSVTAATMTQ
jgi:hypothetical protein